MKAAAIKHQAGNDNDISGVGLHMGMIAVTVRAVIVLAPSSPWAEPAPGAAFSLVRSLARHREGEPTQGPWQGGQLRDRAAFLTDERNKQIR
jgi:hypothetical protein